MILCLRRKSFVSKWFAILLDNSKAAPIRCIASRRTVPDIKNSNYWRSLRPDNNGKMTPSMMQLPCHNLAIDIVMGSAGIKADKGRQSLFRFSFSHLWRWVGKKSLIAYHGHGFPWPREILCKRDIHTGCPKKNALSELCGICVGTKFFGYFGYFEQASLQPSF